MTLVLFVVRKAVQQRFEMQHELRMQRLVTSVRENFLLLSKDIGAKLDQLAAQIEQDPEFRRKAFYIRETRNPLVIDYAGNRMHQMGLDALEIVDQDGIVLSSGQNRNGFGKDVSALLGFAATSDLGIYFTKFERPSTAILCLTSVREMSVGSQRYSIAGGVELTANLLQRLVTDPIAVLQVETEDEVLQTDVMVVSNGTDHWQKSYRMPFVADARIDSITVTLLSSKAELTNLLRELNTQISTVGAAGLLAVIALTIVLTRAVARPLVELAEKSRRLSFDTENTDFGVKSHDEVGLLSDALSDMVGRLRRQRVKLAAAEKRAAFAQLARQVNHDIKNGFIPIRNVMRHWIEVANQEPHKLSEVFGARKDSVLESVEYLENLAKNYARLKPELNITVFGINDVARRLAHHYDGLLEPAVRLLTNLAASEPKIEADPVQLYRALENLLQNALDAIGKKGTVEIVTSATAESALLEITDDGCGMPKDVLSRLFESHVTTKAHGTGLGLVSVKSIVQDSGGSIKVESEEGSGTKIRLTFPLKSW